MDYVVLTARGKYVYALLELCVVLYKTLQVVQGSNRCSRKMVEPKVAQLVDIIQT